MRQAHPTGTTAGFTLVETLLALFLIAIGILALAPMFVFAIQETAVGADFGGAGAVAVERMEQFRAANYHSLVAGGNLDAEVAGYFDTSDPDYVVRWEFSDNASPNHSKTLRVRAIAVRQITGLPKQVTLELVRGR